MVGGLLCSFCMNSMTSFAYAANLFMILLSAYCCIISFVRFFPCHFFHHHPNVLFFRITVSSSSRPSLRIPSSAYLHLRLYPPFISAFIHVSLLHLIDNLSHLLLLYLHLLLSPCLTLRSFARTNISVLNL